MHRVLLVLPNGYQLHAYSTLLLIAFVVNAVLAVRESRRSSRIKPIGYDLPAYIYLASMFGARLFHTLQYKTLADLPQAVFLWRPGLVFYGGVIGGLCACVIYLKARKMPMLATLDFAVPYLITGETITRIGCFLNGCCYGHPTAAPWAVCFPRTNSPIFMYQQHSKMIPPAATATLPVHPFQLYMVASLLLLIVLMWLLVPRNRPDGTVTAAYFCGYGLLRFIMEFFRGDSPQGFLNLTASQHVSLATIALGVIIMAAVVYSRKRLSETVTEPAA